MDDGTQLYASIIPAVRNLTGSQDIPYIFADFVADKDVLDALLKLYNMTKEQRRELGQKCSDHARKNFSMNSLITKWDKNFTKYIEQYRMYGNKNRVKFTKI